MPAFLLDDYETVSNCSKNVEKHTPALFMMYHYKTMSIYIYLKFGVCQTFPILLCTIFKDKFLLIFQFVCLFCLLCSASGERNIKLETTADNVLSNWVSMLR